MKLSAVRAAICRTVRAKVMKGQVILIISSSVIFLIYYCLRCGTEHSIPQLYMKHTAGLLIQLFPKACQGHAWPATPSHAAR
jgi:hypothetical protein